VSYGARILRPANKNGSKYQTAPYTTEKEKSAKTKIMVPAHRTGQRIGGESGKARRYGVG